MKDLDRIQIPRRDLLKIVGAGALLAACEQVTPGPSASPIIASETPRLTESPTPSPTGTPEPTPTTNPTAATGGEHGMGKTGSEVAVRVETAEQAAATYGADNFSRNPANWRRNEFGSFWIERPDGLVTRLNLAGTLFEGWLKSPNPEVNPNNAIAFVAHGIPQMDAIGATLWQVPDPAAEQPILVSKLLNRERIEQPGTLVIEICPPDAAAVTLGTENLNRIASTRVAATRFGLDSYSRNPNNWRINEYGQAHLPSKKDRSTTRIRLDGTVLDGWIGIRSSEVNLNNAIAFAGDPETIEMTDVTGATLWDFKDKKAGFEQIFFQLTQRELIEQPGTLVIPLRECPIFCPPSKGGPAPTPPPAK